MSLIARPRIPLDRICDAKSQPKNCRTWWIREGYSQKYLKDAGVSRDLKTRGWKQVTAFPVVPSELMDIKGEAHTSSLMTYFDVPEELLRNNRQAGVAFSEIGEVFEVYVNGHFIAREGKSGDGKILYTRAVRGVVYQLNPALLKKHDNQILIKLEGKPGNHSYSLERASGYEIGDYEELKHESRDRLALVLMSLYLFLGLYHLLLTIRRGGDMEYLYFGMLGISVAVYLATRSNEVFELPLNSILLKMVELVSIYAAVPLLLAFMDYLFEKRTSRATKAMVAFSVLASLLTLFSPFSAYIYYLRAWQVGVVFVFVPAIFYRLIVNIRAKNPDAGRLLLGSAFVVFCGIWDIMQSGYLYTGVYLLKFGTAVYLMGVAVILAKRYAMIQNRMEELNISLEESVRKRTTQLQSTLTEVEHLKEQQDGDYFLTSLLIKPLRGDCSKSKNVGIDVLEKQKKAFRFRRWQAEIGGDLCIVDNLQLRGKSYVVLLNGDAMGKSIQGAGGALVLGSVFKSILVRTQKSILEQDRSPSEWLQDCFADLQSVFSTFDGSMLVSMVVGLVAEESGEFHYLNAEHPRIVIYREGRAWFMEEETSLRKVGMTLQEEGRPEVRKTRLLPGDVLLVGSDGRDDLAMGYEDGHRIINEDENEFLYSVLQGEGKLPNIERALRERGEITDDFSLIRISYQEAPYKPAGKKPAAKEPVGRRAV